MGERGKEEEERREGEGGEIVSFELVPWKGASCEGGSELRMEGGLLSKYRAAVCATKAKAARCVSGGAAHGHA